MNNRINKQQMVKITQMLRKERRRLKEYNISRYIELEPIVTSIGMVYYVYYDSYENNNYDYEIRQAILNKKLYRKLNKELPIKQEVTKKKVSKI